MAKTLLLSVMFCLLGSSATELLENATAVSDEERLTCNSEKCKCIGANLSRISCFYMDENYFLPKGISSYLRSVKIHGKNFSVYITEAEYDDSWSLVNSFEVYGDCVGDTHKLHLPKQFTRKLSQVKLFRMRNACLISIEENAFMNMSVLENLDLSVNEFLNIRYVELAMFHGSFPKLNSFNMSKTHSGEKMNMHNIRSLLLYQISTIKNLDISWTRTSSIKQVELLSNLKALNMSGTPLLFNDQACLKAVLMLPKLTVWQLNQWPRLTPMTNINIRHRRWGYKNWQYEIHVPFVSCSAINNTRNDCYILPPELKVLSINHAIASEFFINFGKDICIESKLEYLSLRYLRISGPVGNIHGLHDLKSIDISHTGVPFKPKLFHDMEALEVVKASGNSLFLRENETGFAELFIHNEYLSSADLSENEISKLPYNMFCQNSYIQSIDLSSNKLQYINLNLTASKFLKHLFLSNNDFKHLDGGAITLEFISSKHNIMAISGISQDTGLTCQCSSHESARSENAITVAEINDTCNAMKANTSGGINGNGVTMFICYKADLKNITNKLELDVPNVNGLTIGISTLVFVLAVAIIVAIIIVMRRNIKKTPEENPLPDEIELQQNDLEIIEDNGHALDQIDLQDKHGVVENKVQAIDQAAFYAQDHNREMVRNNAYLDIDRLELQDNSRETVESIDDSIAQIELQDHYRKSVQDKERVQYYIGINDISFGTPDRHPRFAAFLAYSRADKVFVVEKLYGPLQKLLRKSFPGWDEELLTVLYDKNFLAGECIMDICRAAVYSSYVTVAIVSDAFCCSTRCHYEMETAIEARVPIIPVYLPGVDVNSFPALMKYIYENNVRIYWPEANRDENISKEELSAVSDLAFSISTNVKHQTNAKQ